MWRTSLMFWNGKGSHPSPQSWDELVNLWKSSLENDGPPSCPRAGAVTPAAKSGDSSSAARAARRPPEQQAESRQHDPRSSSQAKRSSLDVWPFGATTFPGSGIRPPPIARAPIAVLMYPRHAMDVVSATGVVAMSRRQEARLAGVMMSEGRKGRAGRCEVKLHKA